MMFTIDGVLMARRIMDLVFLISFQYTQLFSSTPLLPTPASFFYYGD